MTAQPGLARGGSARHHREAQGRPPTLACPDLSPGRWALKGLAQAPNLGPGREGTREARLSPLRTGHNLGSVWPHQKCKLPEGGNKPGWSLPCSQTLGALREWGARSPT